MNPIDQALYMAIAAVVVRITSDKEVIGGDAPTLVQLAQLRDLRQDTGISNFGTRREEMSTNLLEAAMRKLNESGSFTAPTLRSVAALCLIELLVFG